MTRHDESHGVKYAIVFRHRFYQGLGVLEETIRSKGYEVAYVDPERFDFEGSDPTGADLVVFLGGPFSVNDDANRFIAREIAFAKQRIAGERPTLGICLGAQILAKALGGVVIPGSAREIGWKEVDLTADGAMGPLRYLIGVAVLHWHGDMFSIPPRCLRLASSAVCENQAFAFSNNVLALQFHVEVDPKVGIEDWIYDHPDEIRGHGLDPSALRSQTETAAAVPRFGVSRMINEWLGSFE